MMCNMYIEWGVVLLFNEYKCEPQKNKKPMYYPSTLHLLTSLCWSVKKVWIKRNEIYGCNIENI